MDLKEYRFVQHSVDEIEAQFSFFKPPSEARIEGLRGKRRRPSAIASG